MKNNLSRTASITHQAARRSAHAGFTLIEMMVALSILMLMLAIIFVPLNLGINFFHMGQARAEVQQDAQLTMNQMEADLRQAMFVFPNAAMPGITDQNSNYTFGGDTAGHPYFQSTTFDQVYAATGTATAPTYSANSIVCGGHTKVDNTSRIDFILPNFIPSPTPGAGGIATPISRGPYLVTYYVRRLNPYDFTSASPFSSLVYDAIDNPLVLYRAQVPINKMPVATPPTKNADIDDTTRFGSGGCASSQNDVSAWMAQSTQGEPNLEPLTRLISTQLLPGQVALHDLVTPRGMGLIAPHAADNLSAVLPTPLPTPSFIPETSFICEDSNGDGKIDRVKITISMGEFDTAGAQPTAQSVRLSDTIDLPNIQ